MAFRMKRWRLNFHATACDQGGEKDEEGHVFHAEFVNAHRQHGREACGDTRRADVVARLEEKGDETDQAGKDDGHQTGLDGILRHQADTDGERHGEQSGDGACERIARRFSSVKIAGFFAFSAMSRSLASGFFRLGGCGW
jgi:hypothetical protein